MQIRSGLSNIIKQLPEQDNVVVTYLKLSQKCQTASMFHKMLSRAMYDESESLRVVWKRDVNADIDKDSRLQIISSMGWFTREVRGKLTHFKILHRYCYTPTRLFKNGCSSE